MDRKTETAIGGHDSGIRGHYMIKIGGVDLAFTEHHLVDPVPTGRQIAQTFGGGDPDDMIVLQWLPDGMLEELRLDETVDIRKSGIERFIVTKGDRTFRFVVDGIRFEWPQGAITGQLIRELTNKDDNFEIIQELDDEPDRIVEDQEKVSLENERTERFKSRPVEKLVTVFYNQAPFEIERGAYTTEQLLAIFNVAPGYILDLISKDGDFIELKPGQTIRIKKGMKFVSHAPCGQSS